MTLRRCFIFSGVVMENSGDFSDELDEFEESHEDVKKKVRLFLDVKCFVL